MCHHTFPERDRWWTYTSSLWWWYVWNLIHIVIDNLFIQITEELTRIIFICKGLCSKIVSFNNRYTNDTQINMLVPTMSAQLLLQLDIIAPYSIVMFYGTPCSIVYLCCYWSKDVQVHHMVVCIHIYNALTPSLSQDSLYFLKRLSCCNEGATIMINPYNWHNIRHSVIHRFIHQTATI